MYNVERITVTCLVKCVQTKKCLMQCFSVMRDVVFLLFRAGSSAVVQMSCSLGLGLLLSKLYEEHFRYVSPVKLLSCLPLGITFKFCYNQRHLIA